MRFYATPIKIPMASPPSANLKINMAAKDTSIYKKNIEMKITVRLRVSDFKFYYTAVIIKTIWYWHEDRHKAQWIK